MPQPFVKVTVPGLMAGRVSVDIGGGQRLPTAGLGMWNVTGDDVAPSVRAAIECGYWHIDTAYGYGNETEIGQVLRASGFSADLSPPCGVNPKVSCKTPQPSK